MSARRQLVVVWAAVLMFAGVLQAEDPQHRRYFQEPYEIDGTSVTFYSNLFDEGYVGVLDRHPKTKEIHFVRVVPGPARGGGYSGPGPRDFNMAAFEFERLGRFKDVEIFQLNADAAISDPPGETVLNVLSTLPKLKTLHLGSTMLPADAATMLGKFSGLADFELRNAPNGDAVLAALAACGELHTLDLEGCTLTEKGLSSIAQLPKLTELRLRKTVLSQDAMKALARFRDLRSLDLTGAELSNEAFAELPNLPHLESLGLGQLSLVDGKMASLAKCRDLKELDLSEATFSEQGIGQLGQLGKLESLNLDRRQHATVLQTTVSGSAMAVVGKLPRLRTLSLQNASIAGGGLASLELKELENIDLRGVAVDADALRGLAKSPHLNSLRCSGAKDADLDVIATMGQLEVLDLDKNEITPAHLKSLGLLQSLRTLSLAGSKLGGHVNLLPPLPHLESLDLSDMDTSDTDLAALSKFPGLTVLYLQRAKITDAGLRQLATLGKLESLDLYDAPLADDVIPVLESIPHLKHVVLDLTRISNGGRIQLRDELAGYEPGATPLIDTSPL